VREAFGHRPTTLTDYLATLRRRKWIVIAVPVVAAVVALQVSRTQPPLYEAQATVLVNRTGGVVTAISNVQDPAAFDSVRFLATQADIARSPKLAARVVAAARARGVTPGGLLGASSVTTHTNADLLDFSVSFGNARDAVRLANAYAYEFTRYKTELDTARINDALRTLRARTKLLEKKGQTTSSAYETLVQYEGQLETIGKLLANSTSVLQPAQGATQTQPRPRRNFILGGLLGLVLGIALALLADGLDRRVRTEEEIEHLLGLPLLGRVSRPPRRLRKKNRLVMVDEPTSVRAEMFWKLRSTIGLVDFEQGLGPRTIMFTSAIQREGKSTTIANLAVALARSGSRVALVDLDLRRPFLHSFFGEDAEPGFADVVVGRETMDRAVRRLSLSPAGGSPSFVDGNGGGRPPSGVSSGRSDLEHDLHLVASGAIPPAAGELVASDRVSLLLNDLRGRFDVVLVDAPPLTITSDAMTLSGAVDAIVVVTRFGIDRTLLSEFARELQNCRAPRLGFILTDVADGDGYRNRRYHSAYLQQVHPQAERSQHRAGHTVVERVGAETGHRP